jgi:hypothetical protein
MVDHTIQKGNWTRLLVRLFVLFAILLAIALVMGYFGRSTYRGGYGEHYNFNLASPFCADLSKFYPCDIGIPAIAAFEGFNYLGLGLLLLLPIALVLNWRHVLLIPKRYPALTLVLVGMLAYAVTNYVSYGPHRLIHFPLPAWLDWITGTFRAAGRFFWLIGYLVLFLTLSSLAKKKIWWVNLILVTAMTIQLIDVKPWLKQIKTLAAKPSALNYEEWTPLMSHIDKVVIYPTFECGRGDLQYYTWIMQLAGYHGKLLNSGYTSRDKKDCPNSELVIQEPLQARHLYVLATVTYYETPFTKSFKFPARIQDAMDRGECVKRNDGLMCLPGSKPEFWNNLSLNTYPAKFAENSIFLAGPELNTHIGMPQSSGYNANLIPKEPKQSGWLSFGPSLPLPVGKYKFSLTYLSQEQAAQMVGKWDVVLQQGGAGNEKTLFSGNLSGTASAHEQIDGVFNVAAGQEDMPLEIRTFYSAQGDLQLVSTSLVKLP